MSEVRLILGDCLKVLPTLEAGSVDAVITDCPYGIGVGAAFVRRAGCEVFDGSGGFNEARDDSWMGLLGCLVDGGNLAYFHARGKEPRHPNITEWHRFYFVKQAPPPTPRPLFVSAVEECTIAHKPGKRRWFGGGYTPNYWLGMTPNRLDSDHGHPSEKPVELMRILVESLCPPGGTVLDPYMGVASTGVACIQTGRNFIGIEIDPKYHAIAERRIREAQSTLWTAPKPKQPDPELYPTNKEKP